MREHSTFPAAKRRRKVPISPPQRNKGFLPCPCRAPVPFLPQVRNFVKLIMARHLRHLPMHTAEAVAKACTRSSPPKGAALTVSTNHRLATTTDTSADPLDTVENTLSVPDPPIYSTLLPHSEVEAEVEVELSRMASFATPRPTGVSTFIHPLPLRNPLWVRGDLYLRLVRETRVRRAPRMGQLDNPYLRGWRSALRALIHLAEDLLCIKACRLGENLRTLLRFIIIINPTQHHNRRHQDLSQAVCFMTTVPMPHRGNSRALIIIIPAPHAPSFYKIQIHPFPVYEGTIPQDRSISW